MARLQEIISTQQNELSQLRHEMLLHKNVQSTAIAAYYSAGSYQPTLEQMAQAEKLSLYVRSAIQFDDVPTAIKNLLLALQVLTGKSASADEPPSLPVLTLPMPSTTAKPAATPSVVSPASSANTSPIITSEPVYPYPYIFWKHLPPSSNHTCSTRITCLMLTVLSLYFHLCLYIAFLRILQFRFR